MRFTDGVGKEAREKFDRRLERLQGEAGRASGSTIVDMSSHPQRRTQPITPRPKVQPKPREELDYDTEKAQNCVKRSLGFRYRGTVSHLRAHADEQAKKQVNLPVRDL